jgi:putative RNA 2'-phosphotransferase
MQDNLKNISKFIAEILRHKPEKIGLKLDTNGWANLQELLDKSAAKAGLTISRELAERVVAENDKKRFELSGDGLRIRAQQGHSVTVNLQLPAAIPPVRLYHGTIEKYLPSIMKQGLIPKDRHHVHLSADIETAQRVASRRRGQITVLLAVDCKAMLSQGCVFHLSGNGVWLTDSVDPKFLSVVTGR